MQRLPGLVVIAVVACFFVSGATGLIYEVLWIRMLGLVFGHTVFAVTTVLAAFMAGLGAGSFIFGRIADRRGRALALYGALEIGIGVFCLTIPALMPAVQAAYIALRRGIGLSLVGFAVAQFVLVFLLLLPPTTLMGATLPVLSRLFVRNDAGVARGVGRLYAVNTAGAVLGTALAGYWLVPAFGVHRALYVAAALNMLVGSAMLALDRWPRVRTGGGRVATTARAKAVRRSPEEVAVVVALAVSGAASMTYEIGWTRALALVLGSSTYAFTAMLVAFLVGIAGGSAVFSWLATRGRPNAVLFAVLQLDIAVTALAILPVFEWLPDLMLRALKVSLAPGFVLALQLGFATAAMLVPTFLIGATFPCAVAVAAGGATRVAGDVGRIYAVNTLGAIGGTVLAGFVLMPTVGAQASLKIAVAANALAGVGLLLLAWRAAGRRVWVSATGLAAIVVIGLILVPAWDPTVMASGVSVYARHYTRFAGRIPIGEALAFMRVLYYRDGLGATVSVHHDGTTTLLRVNGKTDASNGLDMHTQLMVGHLPLLAHPNPRRVLIVGLGSGVTVGAVAQHPVERIDVVEIEPAVVEASRFFVADNRHALDDPRVHLTVGDARNFLLATRERYDVIVSEPSNPWMGGIASLFTREFFDLAASRLAPGGVMMTWIDGYTLPTDDLRMVVRTFSATFPDVTIWNAQAVADFMLLGRTTSAPWDLGRVASAAAAAPGLRDDLTKLGFLRAEAIIADFMLGGDDVTRYAAGARLNDDDRLPLEFSAPRGIHRTMNAINYWSLRNARTSAWLPLTPASVARLDEPALQHALGIMDVVKGLPADAVGHFRRALARDPSRVETLVGLGRAHLRLGQWREAAASLEAVVARSPRDAVAYDLLAEARQAMGDIARAQAAAERAVALAPAAASYHTRLATLLLARGRTAEALVHYLGARHSAPDDVLALAGLGAAYLALGRPGDAVPALEEANERQPLNAQLHERLGEAYAAAGRTAEAIGALQYALKLDPANAPASRRLAELTARGTATP